MQGMTEVGVLWMVAPCFLHHGTFSCHQSCAPRNQRNMHATLMSTEQLLSCSVQSACGHLQNCEHSTTPLGPLWGRLFGPPAVA